ncbi:acetyl-CoA carboxylase biotin carboxyl carrier protein [Romboutsia sp.]|uniref:acetyl-CoA carboxylase biotin carboxyl carrier protein n=1 Tax=Romboutsia sp. TaxID=1965302 RepID=UPI002C49B7A9|nr:acetyl-CoA carboxylase biotin carboxyl carrier protein [Romboutsia sp.]HSQ87499.1 acetyl-CoA carboxylase biotin carboxyl carrier protein [Romboutsia sp.]
MKISEIKELLKVIDQTNLEYVKLENSELKLEVSKKVNSINAIPTNNNEIADYSNEVIINDAYNCVSEVEEDNASTIVAPLMGTFYASPSPNESSFVKVGDIVNEGDTLCILEAMKLMNEITSDISGEVVEVLVKNEELVEYNQPLFKIKPL